MVLGLDGVKAISHKKLEVELSCSLLSYCVSLEWVVLLSFDALQLGLEDSINHFKIGLHSELAISKAFHKLQCILA